MSPEEIDKQINRIAWGAKYVNVKNRNDDSVIVILNSLSLKDVNFVDFIYKEAKKEALGFEIFSNIELINEFKRRDIWTETDSNRLEEIRTDLRDLYEQEKELKGSKLKRAQRAIRFLEKRLREKMAKKNSLFGNSIESHANEQRVLATVYCCSYNENDERLWDSWDSFVENDDILFVQNILYKMHEDVSLRTKDVREIARNPHWRFRWNAAKSLGDLFSKPILELDIEQQSLLYWSQVYDSAYEAYERPSQETIEDDDALDEWFKDQDRKTKNERLEKGESGTGKVKVSQKVMRHGEVFICTNPYTTYDPPTIQEVEDMNDSITQEFKKKEQRTIKEKGIINEKSLRHRKNRLARKMIGSKAAVLNRNKMSGHARGRDKRIVPGENIS